VVGWILDFSRVPNPINPPRGAAFALRCLIWRNFSFIIVLIWPCLHRSIYLSMCEGFYLINFSSMCFTIKSVLIFNRKVICGCFYLLTEIFGIPSFEFLHQLLALLFIEGHSPQNRVWLQMLKSAAWRLMACFGQINWYDRCKKLRN